jgi:hypothetical protein
MCFVVSLMAVQVVFRYIIRQGAVLGIRCLPSCQHDLTIFCLYYANFFSTRSTLSSSKIFSFLVV